MLPIQPHIGHYMLLKKTSLNIEGITAKDGILCDRIDMKNKKEWELLITNGTYLPEMLLHDHGKKLKTKNGKTYGWPYMLP